MLNPVVGEAVAHVPPLSDDCQSKNVGIGRIDDAIAFELLYFQLIVLPAEPRKATA